MKFLVFKCGERYVYADVISDGESGGLTMHGVVQVSIQKHAIRHAKFAQTNGLKLDGYSDVKIEPHTSDKGSN